MGVYEECVEVHQPVQGKYCIPKVIMKSTTDQNFTVGKPDEPQMNDNAWREILGVSTCPLHFRYIQFFNLCYLLLNL